MQELATIKFLEDQIITKTGNLIQVWSKWAGDPTNYIVYKGISYRLLKS